MSFRMICVAMLLAAKSAAFLNAAVSSATPGGGYVPIEGGWEVRISGERCQPGQAAELPIGRVEGNARLHRRPLYPPADKTMIWSPEESRQLERCGFRPLVLAYNEPRPTPGLGHVL